MPSKIKTVSNTNVDTEQMFTSGKMKGYSFGDVPSAIQHTKAYNTYQNIIPNVSVREGFGRADYDYFRPETTIQEKRDIIRACMKMARKVSVVRKVTSLMSDFTCQGINWAHPVNAKQEIVRAWWKKVNGPERSERIINTVLNAGNVIVKRTTGKITEQKLKQLHKITGADQDKISDITIVERNSIPIRYTLLNPSHVDVVGEDIGAFIGSQEYVLEIPTKLFRKIQANKKLLSDNFPPEIVARIRKGDRRIPLDSTKITVLHYKKDDWETWADPFTYSILDDVVIYQKAKLADINALEGAISRIRIWQLGNLEYEVIPTRAAFQRLHNEILAATSSPGGVLDLMWGPDLQVKELETNIDKFLGTEKYQQALQDIYAGLGIPPSLTGSGNTGGFTNNMVSLNTLIQQLNYLRDMILRPFWENEIKLFWRAIYPDDTNLPVLIFDRMNLSSEESLLGLYIQLADRNIISDEALLDRFGEIPELEKIRVRKENKKRENGSMPEKASPYYKTQLEHDMKKTFVQKGLYKPEDVDLKPSSINVKKVLEAPAAKPPGNVFDKKIGKPIGRSGEGRPKNSKDSTKRKQKVVKPRSKAVRAMIWARKAQKEISDILTPICLAVYKKDNARQLTDEESKHFEDLKFATMLRASYNDNIQDVVDTCMQEEGLCIPADIKKKYNDCVLSLDTKPSLEELRFIQCYFYVNQLLGDDNGED